jgi:hypothetical protein
LFLYFQFIPHQRHKALKHLLGGFGFALQVLEDDKDPDEVIKEIKESHKSQRKMLMDIIKELTKEKK